MGGGPEQPSDPTKKARELREEFGRKIHSAITAGLNRAGRERIEPAVNRLMQEHAVTVNTSVGIKVDTSAGSMSGKAYVWPEIHGTVEYNTDQKHMGPEQEFNTMLAEEISRLHYDEFNLAGRGHISSTINELIDAYGLGVTTNIEVDIKVNVGKPHFIWNDLPDEPPTVNHSNDKQ